VVCNCNKKTATILSNRCGFDRWGPIQRPRMALSMTSYLTRVNNA
jgi:hypothetical protein